MQNSVNPKLKFDYQQLGAGAAPGSPAGVLSVAFRAQFSLIQFFKQPGQYAFAFPRREAPELCMKRSPNRGRTERRAPNAPAAWRAISEVSTRAYSPQIPRITRRSA